MIDSTQPSSNVAETQARMYWQRVLAFGIEDKAALPITVEGCDKVVSFEVIP